MSTQPPKPFIVVKSDAYKFLWLKSLVGFDPRVHCAKCLAGEYHKGLPYGRANAGLEVTLTCPTTRSDGKPFAFHYLCGVTSEYDRNLHVPFRHAPGHTGVFENNDIRVVIEHAEILPIRPLPADLNLPERYETCRNYQFGYEHLLTDAARMSPTLAQALDRIRATSRADSVKGRMYNTDRSIRNTKRTMMTIEDIARVCHETNRAYCLCIGDASQVPWDEAPQWQRDSAINGVQFTLDNPDVTPEDQHGNWSRVKVADGWVYGEVKDATLKTHPCLVPYYQLPVAQQKKDELFRAVVGILSPPIVGIESDSTPNWAPHNQRETWVKVGVDEGIRDMVIYLNTIPGVSTLYSCQGTIGEGGPHPYRAHVGVQWETEEAFKRLQDEFDLSPGADNMTMEESIERQWCMAHPRETPVVSPENWSRIDITVPDCPNKSEAEGPVTHRFLV